jgi:hypothetical protein
MGGVGLAPTVRFPSNGNDDCLLSLAHLSFSLAGRKQPKATEIIILCLPSCLHSVDSAYYIDMKYKISRVSAPGPHHPDCCVSSRGVSLLIVVCLSLYSISLICMFYFPSSVSCLCGELCTRMYETQQNR